MSRLVAYEAERHTFLLKTTKGVRKLFKIQFSKRDGSLFVHVPYYRQCDGLVSVLSMKPGAGNSADLDLAQGGKVTAHRVKYTHHPDGRAHFSQDTKVISSIRRQSTSLGSFSGHVFTLHIEGPEDFELASAKDQRLRSRANHSHVLRPQAPSTCFKFVGEWVGSERFTSHLRVADVGPLIAFANPPARLDIAFILGPGPGRPPHDRRLMLTCETAPPLPGSDGSCLLLIGGFDEPTKAADLKSTTSLLALQYPASNPASLREAIGSIDLLPSDSTEDHPD